MTAKREIGQHRDAHLEIEELVRKAGPVLESFVQERIHLDGPVPPVKADPNAEAAAVAADDAEALCIKLRASFETARLVLKNKRATLAETIMGWQRVQPKKDTAYLVRENAKAETARKLARIAQGLPPDEVVDQPVHVEPIDQIYASRRGSVNVNWRRPPGSWRGAPAPKVASER